MSGTPTGEPGATGAHDRIRTLDEALKRLDVLLPEHDPELSATLNPPVAADDLQALREALAPHELHDDVAALLQWHDGQSGETWWPVIQSGPLLSATAAAEHRQRMAEMCEEPFQWSPSWVPIAHQGWYTIAVECGVPLGGLVIDAGFPDPPRPKALSLAEMLRPICELIEAGFPLDSSGERDPDKVVRTGPWLDVLRRGYPHFLQ